MTCLVWFLDFSNVEIEKNNCKILLKIYELDVHMKISLWPFINYTNLAKENEKIKAKSLNYSLNWLKRACWYASLVYPMGHNLFHTVYVGSL